VPVARQLALLAGQVVVGREAITQHDEKVAQFDSFYFFIYRSLLDARIHNPEASSSQIGTAFSHYLT